MYEIIKALNETTFIALENENVYILKKTAIDELELYKKLEKVKSKYVCKVYGTTVIDENIYAVCEYVFGKTLEKYVEECGPLSDEEIISIASCICDGLKQIHESGIVHRDITPNNIIITSNGEAKIIDFGISRIVKENAPSDTYILGTQGYAAPEQFGFHQTDEKTDIYAVGVIINFMKTGCLPGEKKADGKFRWIVEKCIEIDEKNRFESTDELKSALLKKHIKNDFKLSNIFYLVPGFVKNNSPATAFSTFYYFAVALLASSVDYVGYRTIVFDYIPMFFMLLLPYFILWDIGGWTEKLGIKKSDSRIKNLVIRLGAAFISFMIGGIITSFSGPST